MRRAGSHELTGWAAAILVSVITVAQVASASRADLLFRDGDALVVAQFVRSATEGRGIDWAMSPVLFVPEIVLFAALWLISRLVTDANGVLAVNAVVNLVLLYGAFRAVAGRRRPGGAPVAGSLLALCAFCLIALTETSPSRDALELASLLLTTTYYSATVFAVVVSVALLRRLLDGSLRPRVILGLLGGVAAISTLSNPLYAAWATVPLAMLLGVAGLSETLRRRALLGLGVLIVGTGLGFLARIPLSAWIANSGAGYAHPELWRESAAGYGSLLLARLHTPLGASAVVLLLAVWVYAVVRAVSAESVGARFVAAAAASVPPLVLGGAIVLGTEAARYLEPLAFAPLLVLIDAARPLRLRGGTRRTLGAIFGVALIVGGGVSVPRLVGAASRPDADLTCVVDWVEDSGRTGAGQFWTVRLPQLQLADPAQLVQVDYFVNGYAWLTNRSDFAVGDVSFLLEDSASVPWELPEGTPEPQRVSCGRYTILDFAPTTLVIGPARS